MSYAVKEIFNTLQGEGARAGRRSVFIRFAGCNLWTGRPEDRDKGNGACAQWCDTDFFKGEKMTAEQIVEKADELWPYVSSTDERYERWVVLTGGEPTLQVDDQLIDALYNADWRIAMESNGTKPAPARIDWLTISPKLGTELVQLQANELKVVLPGGDPGWTDDQLRELEFEFLRWSRKRPRFFVQPQDPIVQSQLEASHLRKKTLGAKWDFDANLKRCIDFVMANPYWGLSYQVHKAVDLP